MCAVQMSVVSLELKVVQANIRRKHARVYILGYEIQIATMCVYSVYVCTQKRGDALLASERKENAAL